MQTSKEIKMTEMEESVTGKKRIIALWGCANCGKTTVLNGLIDKLINTKNAKQLDKNPQGRDQQISLFLPLEKKHVIITTSGDDMATISGNVTYAKGHAPWDVFITATRTRGATCDVITEYASEQKAELIWEERKKDDILDTIQIDGLMALI